MELYAVLIAVFVAIAIFGCTAIWKTRSDMRDLDPEFRTRIETCTTEYWAKYVFKPLNGFYETANDLIVCEHTDHPTLQDVLLDNDYKSMLEEFITEATEAQGVTAKLDCLFDDHASVIRETQRRLAYFIILIVLLAVATIVDFTVRVTLKEAIERGFGTDAYNIVTYFSVGICTIIFIFILYGINEVIKSWNRRQSLDAFLVNCERSCANAPS